MGEEIIEGGKSGFTIENPISSRGSGVVVSDIEDVTMISRRYGVYVRPFAYESNVQNVLLEWLSYLLTTVLPDKNKIVSQSTRKLKVSE